MSAFTVNQAHIDALVLAGVQYRIVDALPDTMAELGQLLWDENYRSVNYRYSESEHAPEYRDPPRRGIIGRRLVDAAIAKAVHCYEYQSCEHPEWRDSKAAQFCDALKAAVLRNIAGYDAAPWEVDSVDAISERGESLSRNTPPLGSRRIVA